MNSEHPRFITLDSEYIITTMEGLSKLLKMCASKGRRIFFPDLITTLDIKVVMSHGLYPVGERII